MKPQKDKHTEPATKETAQKSGPSIEPKQGTAYTQISRMLSETDLKQPAVVKMIINERDSLQAEITEFRKNRTLFQTVQTENAVLKEKLKTFTAFEVLSLGCVSVGSAFLGFSINPFDTVYLVLGIILLIAGIIAKVVKIK